MLNVMETYYNFFFIIVFFKLIVIIKKKNIFNMNLYIQFNKNNNKMLL